jgi:hypothetical protein
MAYPISMGAGNPSIQGTQVVVEYSSTYFFLGPLIGWFGGSLSTVPVRGVAVMRNEVPSS